MEKYDHIKSIVHSDFLDRPAKTVVNTGPTNTVLFPCPKCGELAIVDTSLVLTTYPGQYEYSCPHCGAQGFVLCSEVDKYCFEQNIRDVIGQPRLHGIKCIICGEESTFVDSIEQPHVCKKCRKAILKLRKMLEEEDD